MPRKYVKLVLPSDTDIANAVTLSNSIAQTLKRLGLSDVNNTRVMLKRKIGLLQLSTAHFTGQGWARGMSSLTDTRITSKYEAYLAGEKRGHVDQAYLRKALEALGVKEKCSCCGVSEWLGKRLRIEIDHIDGDPSNNVPSNLRYLCPNCHSQTETFAGKNIRKSQPKVSEVDIINAVPGCENVRQVLIRLGLRAKGDNYYRVYDVMGKHGVKF